MNTFENKINSIEFKNSTIWDMEDLEEYGIKLSAPACYIRGWNLNYVEIDNVDDEQLDKLLEAAYISDKESLLASIEESVECGVGDDYDQFITFWNDAPCFDVEQLPDAAKKAFFSCMAYADKFRNIVGDNGFWAWDYAETIPLIRMGFMNEWINYNEARELLFGIANEAKEKYSSWKDFAISYICGGAYFMFKNTGLDEEEADKFFDVLCSIVQELFNDNGGEYWD